MEATRRRSLSRESESILSTAEPIRRLEDIRAIKELLANRPRDLVLFLLGINNGVRAGDLLRLTVRQATERGAMGRTLVREKESGGKIPFTIPPAALPALGEYLRQLEPPPPPADMYLFASQRGWTPLTTNRLDELVVEWTRSVGLEGEYGAHTLRKTFGYVQRTRFGVDFGVLARRLGLPTPAAAMRYLGLSSDVAADVILQEL